MILVWDDTLDFMQNYYDTNGWTATDCYLEASDQVLQSYSNAFYTGSTGHPQNALIDRDGDVRLYAVGAIDGSPATQWENAIKELLGIL